MPPKNQKPFEQLPEIARFLYHAIADAADTNGNHPADCKALETVAPWLHSNRARTPRLALYYLIEAQWAQLYVVDGRTFVHLVGFEPNPNRFEFVLYPTCGRKPEPSENPVGDLARRRYAGRQRDGSPRKRPLPDPRLPDPPRAACYYGRPKRRGPTFRVRINLREGAATIDEPSIDKPAWWTVGDFALVCRDGAGTLYRVTPDGFAIIGAAIGDTRLEILRRTLEPLTQGRTLQLC